MINKINQFKNFFYLQVLTSSLAQDYDVSDIQCSFSSQGSNLGDLITAKLKKPSGFKGHPLFADDRGVNPETDFSCTIRPDRSDPNELNYDLKVIDFTRCGVLKRNVSVENSNVFFKC